MGAQRAVLNKQEGKATSFGVGGLGWPLPEILPCVLAAFSRQSLLLWLTVRLVSAWLASAFQE